MPIFRKKPVCIEAVQFNNDETSYHLLHWINESQHTARGEFATWHNNMMIIPTLGGYMKASPGDWIIRGIKGELYPCRDDIFTATYDPVT